MLSVMRRCATSVEETSIAEQPAVLSARKVLVCCAILAFSAALAGAYIKSGWIAGDDGLLATSAARVMHGQLPHRDFVENYTGGLSYLNALAFRAFGVNLVSMRIPVFCFFLAWVPAVFYLASRVASPLGAVCATLLSVVWSFPNYPAPMPSWYNLFLATFGASALFRYLDTEQRRWLYIAGLFGGASFLIKVIGLYYVAGVLLFLVYREQLLNRSANSGRAFGSVLYRIFVVGSLLLFLTSIFYLIHPRESGRFVHFVIPVAAVTAVLIANERHPSSANSWRRFASLFRMIIPFLLGAMCPVAVFLVPYIASGSTGTLLHGVFGLGVARANSLAVFDPPAAICFIFAIPPMLALAIGFGAKPRTALMASAVVALIGVLLLSVSGRYELTPQLVFESAEMLAPICVVVGAAQLASGRIELGALRRQQLMLLLCMAALCALVQFPFAAPIYFCYYAPLLILAMFAVVSSWRQTCAVSMLTAVVGFYFLFALVYMAPTHIYRFAFTPPPPHALLSLPAAGGLRVPSSGTLETMVATVQSHSTNHQVLAFPECPEVYFLTGLRNPTRNDGGALPEDVNAVLASNEVNVIVINDKPYFASKPAPDVMAAIERRLPFSRTFGKYLVRWRQ